MRGNGSRLGCLPARFAVLVTGPGQGTISLIVRGSKVPTCLGSCTLPGIRRGSIHRVCQKINNRIICFAALAMASGMVCFLTTGCRSQRAATPAATRPAVRVQTPLPPQKMPGLCFCSVSSRRAARPTEVTGTLFPPMVPGHSRRDKRRADRFPAGGTCGAKYPEF
jgi:hypothetical protein